MVNQKFHANFLKHIQDEFGTFLGGPPSVHVGGTQVDHYKGLASSLAKRVVPLYRESYQPTEFLYGAIPVKNNVLPRFYFQTAVLDVKGKNVPGVGNFGSILRAQVPETYVAPYADWKYRLLPLSAFTSDSVSASKVFKGKVNWTPFLEAVNSDKPALKALGAPWNSSRVGDYKISMDSQRIPGFIQLAPYKGFTLMTLETTPGVSAGVDGPDYDLKKNHDNLLKIAMHALAHPQKGVEIGDLYLNQSNAAMMDLMIKAVDKALAPPPGPSPAPPIPPAPLPPA
ncbi:MAG TPA: hypothetical protein VJ397_00660 [Thermoplasmata archaeon]|nr:hypothetical protein [Thermoplasmata archaeon]